MTGYGRDTFGYCFYVLFPRTPGSQAAISNAYHHFASSLILLPNPLQPNPKLTVEKSLQYRDRGQQRFASLAAAGKNTNQHPALLVPASRWPPPSLSTFSSL